MNSLVKVFACCVYCALLVACSIVFAGLCVGIREVAIYWQEPARWAGMMAGIFLVVSLMVGAVEWHTLWYVVLFFGGWASLLPPRQWWSSLAFVLATLVAGVWASYSYQMFGWPVFPFEAGLEILPPSFHLVSLTTTLSCIDALVSTTLCLYLVRRWFRCPPPNNALQRTEAGGGAFSDHHA